MTARLPPVPSPCVNVCQLDPASDLCRGCGRTLQEIADWLDMTPEQKLAVLQRLAERSEEPGDRLRDV